MCIFQKNRFAYTVKFYVVLGLTSFAITAGAQTDLPIESTRNFVEIIEKIKKNYVREISDEELFDYAIRGMLNSLDPHSSYLDTSEKGELQIRTSGEFGGLGIQISLSEEGFVRVISPIDDTPADEAGIQPQDLIIRLNGKPVQGKTLEDVLQVMRGKPGTKITLTIVREGDEAPFDVTIIRDIIRIRSVRASDLGDGFGYIRVSSFQANTAEDLRSAFDKLQDELPQLRGLVLDLRRNPGGLLPAAVDVSDFFLPAEKVVVYTEGRATGNNQKFFTKMPDFSGGLPLVVLTDGGSASASEIVAGALQDHKRAVVLGEKTFGKGSVQTIVPLENNNAIKITTALFFTPNGRSIQVDGVNPDIHVTAGVVEEEQLRREFLFREEDLDRHLGNANRQQDEKQDDQTTDNLQFATELRDNQIRQAFHLLKGLSIYTLIQTN